MIGTVWRASVCWCAMDSLVCSLIDWSWGIGTDRWGRLLWRASEMRGHKWEVHFGFINLASANVSYQMFLNYFSVLSNLSACSFGYPQSVSVFSRIGLRWEHALLLALTFTQARHFQPRVRRSKENWLGHSLCTMQLYRHCCTAVWI